MNERIKHHIERFAEDRQIAFVAYEPEPWAEANRCFGNVIEKVNRDGGLAQYGWYFAVMPGILSALHHAVWRSPDGRLADVTPFQGSELLEEGKVVFIADNAATPIMMPGCVIGVARPSPLVVHLNKKARRTAREMRRLEWEYGEVLEGRLPGSRSVFDLPKAVPPSWSNGHSSRNDEAK